MQLHLLWLPPPPDGEEAMKRGDRQKEEVSWMGRRVSLRCCGRQKAG